MKLTGIVTALTLGGTAALAAPDGAGMRLWDADGDGALSRGEVAAIQLDAFDTFDYDSSPRPNAKEDQKSKTIKTPQ